MGLLIEARASLQLKYGNGQSAEDVSIELVSLREDWACYTARIIWVSIQMGGQLPLWTRYYFEWEVQCPTGRRVLAGHSFLLCP